MSTIFNQNGLRNISRVRKIGLAVGGAWIALFGAACAHAQTTAPSNNVVYTYAYDNNSNLLQTTDALNHITKQSYDALNRRATQTDAISGLTQYGYDSLDHLISVTDPRKLVTTYQIDGLNNLNQLQSPDTGATINSYDLGGNLLAKTDAKGQVTRYGYDALNRLTSITYADKSSVSYTYDQGSNALGRLSRIADASGTIQYAYDVGGRVLSETRTINVVAALNGSPSPTTYITSYSYDSVGQLLSITYPSGRTLTYARDGIGRISKITSTRNNVTTTVVSNVTYRPFSGVQSYVNSVGNTYTRGFDQAGRITSYTLNGTSHSLSYDGASNIVGRNDSGSTPNSTTYNYDPLNRLTGALTSTSSLSYAYDPNGNRTSQSNGSASAGLTYASSSNQLTQITGAQTMPIAIDANGSITNNGVNQFNYDVRGRLISATTASGPVQYVINPLGQRVQKITTAGSTVYEYDQSGKLIGEANGQHGTDYVYLDEVPVAAVQM